MKLSELCQKLTSELPTELQKDLATIEIDGFAIGLKKNKHSFFRGHDQIFVLGGDNDYVTLFGLDKKYADIISPVASKLGINYVRGDGIISRLSFFTYGEKIIASGMIGDNMFKFREYIKNYREKMG